MSHIYTMIVGDWKMKMWCTTLIVVVHMYECTFMLFLRVYGDRCHFLGWRAGIYLVQGQNRDRRAALRWKVRLQVDARPGATLESG